VIEKSGLHLIPLFICRGQLNTYFAHMLEIAHFFLKKIDTGPPASGFLVETCIACFYSNQNVDKTSTILLG